VVGKARIPIVVVPANTPWDISYKYLASYMQKPFSGRQIPFSCHFFACVRNVQGRARKRGTKGQAPPLCLTCNKSKYKSLSDGVDDHDRSTSMCITAWCSWVDVRLHGFEPVGCLDASLFARSLKAWKTKCFFLPSMAFSYTRVSLHSTIYILYSLSAAMARRYDSSTTTFSPEGTLISLLSAVSDQTCPFSAL
jgi:hypothetical protein